MPTHAELASQLLKDASTFFRTLADQNEQIRTEMLENATVFEQMSGLLASAPTGETNNTPHAELAGRLLQDAAGFFRKIAEENEPIKDQMNENAGVFEQIGSLVMQNPLGTMD